MSQQTEAPVINGVHQRRVLKTAVPGPRSLELRALRQNAISNGFGIALPVFIERAAGGILVDVDGNQHIDLASGIAVTTVGGSHPEVTSRIADQAARFTHTCFSFPRRLSAIEKEGLVERAREIEALVLPRLLEIADKHGLIGEVRGRGAMLAIELVKPDGTAPAPEMARLVSAYCHREGVLTLVCGAYGNVIRLFPPLVISEALLHEALDVLEQGVAAAADQTGAEA